MQISAKQKFKIKDVIGKVSQANEFRNQAAVQAIMETAQEMKKELEVDIRKGEAGEASKYPLTGIGKKTGKGSTTRPPLKSLSKGIEFRQITISGKKKGSRNSKTRGVVRWEGPMRGIAKIHQTGFVRKVTPGMRKFFVNFAHDNIPKGSKFWKYFFLRKSTKVFFVPDRNVLAPWWDKHEKSAITRAQYKYGSYFKGKGGGWW